MLFKNSTQIARDAAFFGSEASLDGAGGGEVMEPPEPSGLELDIAILARENEALQAEIARLRAERQGELVELEQRARAAAARDHVRDDEKRLAALIATLEEAQRLFARELVDAGKTLAVEIAVLATEKLVALRKGDSDWLARIIDRRLTVVDRNAVVCLQLSPADAAGGIASAILERLPPGTAVEPDPALLPGSARLRLRLGAIEFTPEAGWEHLSAVLRENAADA